MHVLTHFLTSDEIIALRGLARSLHFEPGRQGTGYDKAAVPSDSFRALRGESLVKLSVNPDEAHDCYLVRYMEGAFIPMHVDDAPLANEHWRINAVVTMPEAGGELFVGGSEVKLRVGDAYVFRPDKEEHEVRKVIAGTRLIWTVGCLR